MAEIGDDKGGGGGVCEFSIFMKLNSGVCEELSGGRLEIHSFSLCCRSVQGHGGLHTC